MKAQNVGHHLKHDNGGAPGRNRTCDTRFRKRPAVGYYYVSFSFAHTLIERSTPSVSGAVWTIVSSLNPDNSKGVQSRHSLAGCWGRNILRPDAEVLVLGSDLGSSPRDWVTRCV